MQIKNITIANGTPTPIPLSNLVVIVGPNGSGKTRFLNELHSAITKRQLSSNFWRITIGNIQIDDADRNVWINSLVKKYKEPNNQEYWVSDFTHGESSPDGIEIPQQEYDKIINNPSKYANHLLPKELTHYLSVETRLQTTHITEMRDATDKPTNIIEILQGNSTLLLPKINKHLQDLFSKQLKVIVHRLPKIELIICNKDCIDPPTFDINNRSRSAQEYLRWKEEHKVGYLSQEGHGLRAFLNIMLRNMHEITWTFRHSKKS